MHKRRSSLSERSESGARCPEGEDMHELSDRNLAKNTTSSIDTPITSFIGIHDETPAKSDTAGERVLGEIALDIKVRE